MRLFSFDSYNPRARFVKENRSNWRFRVSIIKTSNMPIPGPESVVAKCRFMPLRQHKLTLAKEKK